MAEEIDELDNFDDYFDQDGMLILKPWCRAYFKKLLGRIITITSSDGVVDFIKEIFERKWDSDETEGFFPMCLSVSTELSEDGDGFLIILHNPEYHDPEDIGRCEYHWSMESALWSGLIDFMMYYSHEAFDYDEECMLEWIESDLSADDFFRQARGEEEGQAKLKLIPANSQNQS